MLKRFKCPSTFIFKKFAGVSAFLLVFSLCGWGTNLCLLAASAPSLRIHFIDVGYGDAILIQCPDQTTVLVDAGEEPGNAGLADYLKSRQIDRIDTAVITHPHTNHFQGFFDVVEHLSVGRLMINGDPNSEPGYEELLEKFRGKNIPIEVVRRGEILSGLAPAVRVSVLHPAELRGNPNANSIVLRLLYGKTEVLLMGDIEPVQQDELMTVFPDIRDIDAVKVPHHGGPLSEQFCEIFKDKIFVISTGENPWGIPGEEDLRKLKGAAYRTDHSGTIILETDGQKISVKTEGEGGG